jgi:hypothetical protein
VRRRRLADLDGDAREVRGTHAGDEPADRLVREAHTAVAAQDAGRLDVARPATAVQADTPSKLKRALLSADNPRIQAPKDALGSLGTAYSTANRPAGVGVAPLPTSTEKVRTGCPSCNNWARADDRVTSMRHGDHETRAKRASIQPTRPFGRCGSCTPRRHVPPDVVVAPTIIAQRIADSAGDDTWRTPTTGPVGLRRYATLDITNSARHDPSRAGRHPCCDPIDGHARAPGMLTT